MDFENNYIKFLKLDINVLDCCSSIFEGGETILFSKDHLYWKLGEIKVIGRGEEEWWFKVVEINGNEYEFKDIDEVFYYIPPIMGGFKDRIQELNLFNINEHSKIE